ncbi:MAG TPA: RNB domain-containing ribonuclease [Alphaproteobacteria bacterium]|nr:RNB domain-containing ribonuclease [Alphaproteobacteria bacterium]
MRKPKYPFNKKNVKLALDLNPEAVSFESLANGFGFKKSDWPQLQSALSELTAEGLITERATGSYISNSPISDLVIVKLSERPSRRAVELEIMGVKGDQPFSVTISDKQIRKIEQKEGKRLSKGSILAVTLERTNGLNLKVKKIVGRKERDKKIHLTVAFKNSADHEQPVVTSLSPVSLTAFNAFGKIPPRINPRKDFRASLPDDYDPYNPSLEIESAKWDPKTGTPIYMIVARKNGIPPRHSSEANLEARRMAGANFFKDKSRRDLRNERILVIDPPNAHDHDDGIFIEHTDQKIDGVRAYYRTLVVIADVPFFVRPGSVLEKEAQERGYTHYFDRNALHLYPSIFADRKASLKTGKLRPVIYVEKFWDAEGRQIGMSDISTGIIESQRVMTYGQFQDLVDINDPSIWPYQELGDSLIQRYRHESGLVFDGDDHNDVRSSYARALVASMMQDANQEIAEFLEYYNLPYLRRAHGAKENLYAYQDCKDSLEQMGYDIPDTPFDLTINQIQKLFSLAEERQERPVVERYVRQYLLNQAKYTTADVGHFGLNMPRYTHATSPIRRYPDLLTLRAVHTAIGDIEMGLSDRDRETMDDVAEKMNRLQDLQRNTALDYERYFSVARLASQEGFRRNVVFSGIKYPYIYIDLPLGKKGALRKEIHFTDLPTPWGISQSHNQMLYRGNVVIPVGSTLKITIKDVKPETGEWSFDDMVPGSKIMSSSVQKRPGPRPVSAVA